MLFLTLILFILVLFGCPFIGPTALSYGKVFHAWPPVMDNPDSQIFFSVRLPRNLLAALAGAAMACAGIIFQAVLRNPLACPFTLGVAGGSSFGAVIAILLGLTTTVYGISTGSPSFLLWAPSFPFSWVYSLATLLRSFSAITILFLAGSRHQLFLQRFGAAGLLHRRLHPSPIPLIHWMMGCLDVVDLMTVEKLSLGIMAGFMVLFFFARELNLLSAGEELAKVKGVATSRVILVSILVASLMTSAVVDLTGPIAFVGLIIPHIFRLWIGNDHRFLLPCSTLGKELLFSSLCDTVARSFFGPTEVPVGVLTALLGVPVLLWLLFRRKAYCLQG